ncbi:hypothetical protein QIS99_23400 [Streptomyces sp. B-S-A8]|uniref:AMP-binding enzyme C-terminal domain-containing protein n=1 Tax=Streptomyces solicavernae TaxID=3043614 RepID=A0ABT6RXF9_9ACTN|nr:hypothetical protein [Streptomyces sp. B-S-A8]MDI3389119.1 hypothetical protein [Streptomyces sp. B-S-A8]
MPNIAQNLSETARRHPARPALRFDGHVITLPKGQTGKILKREIRPPR